MAKVCRNFLVAEVTEGRSFPCSSPILPMGLVSCSGRTSTSPLQPHAVRGGVASTIATCMCLQSGVLEGTIQMAPSNGAFRPTERK